MNKQFISRGCIALLSSLAIGATTVSFAQTPQSSTAAQKPARIIVAFAAGGPVDFVARTIADPLAKELGRAVLVENRPGASGAIGAAEVLRSEPDGATMWITSVGAAAINPALFEKMSYDMKKDFAPVSLVVNNVEIFVTNTKNTANDALEFINAAKAKKEPTAIGSSGTGSIPHLAMLQLEDSTKADLLHVPYNGMAPAITDLMGGQVAAEFADVPAVINYINGGRLKPLAIASNHRSVLLPNVKTFEELGIKAVDTNNWYAIFVSAKTPKVAIDRLNASLKRVLDNPATASKLTQSGAEPKWSSPQDLANLLDADTTKWSKLIKSKNIKAEQ
jgi:tripartite-type tricarboxylate transporter receptor subunit TctC